MSRAAATGVVALLSLAVGLASWWWWPSSTPALPCAASDVVLDEHGVARCKGPGVKGAPLPAGQALTVGQKLDLNQATADDLAQIPHVGPELAKALVEERRRLGRFHSWDEVDAVNGVGATRLSSLREVAEIHEVDAGLW